jgi:hypothetical protein
MPAAPRSPRIRLAVVGVAALALGAACQPVKNSGPSAPGVPTKYCAPSVPTNAGQYQQAFDNLRKFNTGGWIANDGGYPFDLGDGRVLWLFGDTLIGTSPGGPVKTLLGIVNNGFVVQDGECFTPMTEPVPDPDLPGDHWIWPTGAVVAGNTLRVFGLHMQRTTADPPFDFALVGVDVAVFSLPGVAYVRTDHLPLDAAPTYGTAVLFEPDGYVYAYGGAVAAGAAEQYVARAKPAELLDGSKWEFWNGSVFVPNDPSARVPMSFKNTDGTPTTAPRSGFPVAKNPNGGYLGSAFPADLTDTTYVETWRATDPQGPWTRVATPAVNTTGYIGNPQQGRFVYGGRVVPDLAGVEPFALWSTHHEDFDLVLENPDRYKVWFAPADLASIPTIP